MAKVTEDIQKLLEHLRQWDNGDFEDNEAAVLIDRYYRRVMNGCYCHEDVCCEKHGKHVMLHRFCILR